MTTTTRLDPPKAILGSDRSERRPMTRLRGWLVTVSPVVWLRLVIFAVCLSIIGLRGWHEWTDYNRTVEDIEDNLATLARSLMQQTEDLFDAADVTLSGVLEQIGRDGTSPQALQRLNLALAHTVASQHRVNSLTVFDAEGRWLAGSSPLLRQLPNVSDRPFFVHHKHASHKAPFLGRPVRSITRGQWVLPLSRRISTPDGGFAGVVVATLDAQYFADVYAVYRSKTKGAIALLSESGILLTFHPFREELVGTDFSSHEFFKEGHHLTPGGSYRYVSPVTGDARLSGYHFGLTYPVFTLVNVTWDEALAPWTRAALSRAADVVVLLGVIVALGWWLDRLLRRDAAVRAQLARLAATDGLTGLANRRLFDERLAQEWGRALREATPLSLLLIDVDRFKRYNDSYGHQEGDQCLQAVAGVLAGMVRRPADLVARYGGEELAVLLPGCDRAGAAELAEGLRARVEGLGLPHAGNPPAGVVTISIGSMTLLPRAMGSDLQRDDCVALADQALYAAKAQGRNRVVAAPHPELLPDHSNGGPALRLAASR